MSYFIYVSVQPSNTLDHPHWSLFFNHQLAPVSRSQTAPSDMPYLENTVVERASSYSSCSLSVRSFIVTKLFSIVILWSWTACWPFSWRFPNCFKTFLSLKYFPLEAHLSLPRADFLELWPLIVRQSLSAVVLVSAAD